jgi:hypothetical protein
MKTSRIYETSDIEFTKIVLESKSYSDVLIKCGLPPRGANNKTLKRRIEFLKINSEHLKSNKGKKFTHRQWSLYEASKSVFVENSNTNTNTVKNLILRFNLVPYKCECGLTTEWRNKLIVLQLEHKNGNHRDNRIENLCFLCPNCHSQTATYAGKSSNLKLNKVYIDRFDSDEFRQDCLTLTCSDIKKKHGITQHQLRKICGLLVVNIPLQKRNQKIKWNDDSLKKLSDEVTKTSLRKLGKLYGVSANRLKEICREHHIVVPKIKKHCSLI